MRPALSSSSISSRCSRAMLPWWARTSSSPASSLRRWASRSLRRRLFVKTIVLVWLRISSRIRGWIAGQMLVRRSGLIAGPPGCCSWGSDVADGAHVVDRDDDLQLERLARAGVDDGDLAVRPDAAEEAADGLERSLRGGEADALRRLGAFGPERLQAFQAQGEVGTPFRAGHRVDLVDDDVLDAAQDLARLAREQEIQALGRRDEDVGGVAGDLAAVLGRGVAGSAGDGDLGRLVAEPLGRQADAGERGTQVALDVVGQGLERGDVEDPDVAGLAALRRRAWVLGEAVDRVEEGGQGLATPRGRVDERVLAAGDGGPALGLGLGRRLETRLEPGPNGGRKRGERIGNKRGGHGTD